MSFYNKHVESFYVKETIYNNKSEIDFIDEIRIVHKSLLCTEMKPHEQEYYLQLGSPEAVALHILSLPHMQEKVKEKYGYWPKDQWVIGEFRNLRIWVNLRDRFISYGVLQNNWDNKQVDYMLLMIKEGDVVIDIGASIGVYTLQAARMVGNTGKVIAIEPQKSISTFLEKSILENHFENICTVHQIALGDIKGRGRVVLCNDETNPGASYVTTNSTLGHYNVPLNTLDALKIEKINFIKLDAQGNELKVLEGGKKTLAQLKPILLIDINQHALRDIGKASLEQIINFLYNLEYNIEIYNGEEQFIPITNENLLNYNNLEPQLSILARPTRNLNDEHVSSI